MKWTLRAIAVAITSLSASALAQSGPDNAVVSADDAFGISVGRESIGLYTAGSVRGFSANTAGNTRIEGLYFDSVWVPSPRIRRGSTIRVGISAQGFPFPAPTGIVDYRLRKPDSKPSASLFGSINSGESIAFEFDGDLTLSDRLSVAAGAGLYRNVSQNGTSGNQNVEGLTAIWRPSPRIEVQPFWSRSDIRDDEFGPVYIPAGAYLPPRIERGDFRGPDRPKYRSTAVFYGAIARVDLANDLQIRGSAVRTHINAALNGTHLLLNVTPDGGARRVFIVDPPSLAESDSGELRLTKRFSEGPRLHSAHLNLRARNRLSRYGGSDVIDLGPTEIDDSVAPIDEDFAFSEQAIDRVRQWTGGIAYDLRWRGVGELSLGAQRTDYEKRILQPGIGPAATRSKPWLYNASGALHLSERVALYAAYTRGLEESGVAPSSASNRDEALPAIVTEQREGGLRWSMPGGLKLIAGLFDVRKPYYQLDERNTFAQLGQVRHQGGEVSLSGPLSERLTLVAGGVFLRPRVTGTGVKLGRVGARPVGQPEHNLQLSLDWRPALLEGLSFDIGASYIGRRPATRDNRVELPRRTLLDAGLRYRMTHGERALNFRAWVSNAFDVYSLELRGSGVYDTMPGRIVGTSVSVDF